MACNAVAPRCRCFGMIGNRLGPGCHDPHTASPSSGDAPVEAVSLKLRASGGPPVPSTVVEPWRIIMANIRRPCAKRASDTMRQRLPPGCMILTYLRPAACEQVGEGSMNLGTMTRPPALMTSALGVSAMPSKASRAGPRASNGPLLAASAALTRGSKRPLETWQPTGTFRLTRPARQASALSMSSDTPGVEHRHADTVHPRDVRPPFPDPWQDTA